MGGIIADMIIIIIFVLSTIHGYWKGLNSFIFQVMSWLITFAVLIFLCGPITDFIIDKTDFDEFISSKIQISLEKNFRSNFEEGKEIKESNISDSIVNKINKYIVEAKNKAVENIAEYVADRISYTVVFAVILLIIFSVTRLIAIMIKFVLDFIICIPGISAFDKAGGAIYGVVRAYATIYIILAIFSLASPVIADSGVISMIKSSHICSIFYDDNIVLKAIG